LSAKVAVCLERLSEVPLGDPPTPLRPVAKSIREVERELETIDSREWSAHRSKGKDTSKRKSEQSGLKGKYKIIRNYDATLTRWRFRKKIGSSLVT